MKTIQLLAACIQNMNTLGIPANIQIGTFKVESAGSLINWAGRQGEYKGSNITFQITFRTHHIQHLLDMGVHIEFESVLMTGLSEKALRFKKGREAIKQGLYAPYYYKGDPCNPQTGAVENWLSAKATCDICVLKMIEKYCRENHRDEVYIDNYHNITNAGWPGKIKYATGRDMISKRVAKMIRQNVAAKNKKNLLPVEKRAVEQKKYEAQ